jgi:hypothetical protein
MAHKSVAARNWNRIERVKAAEVEIIEEYENEQRRIQSPACKA